LIDDDGNEKLRKLAYIVTHKVYTDHVKFDMEEYTMGPLLHAIFGHGW